MNPTLKDIATKAKVSIKTVSRVINGSKPVSEKLERKVKQAIEELGFEPRRVKERTNRKVIAFIAMGVANPANTAIMTGAQEEADKSGLGLMILTISENFQEENLKLLRHFNFDGIILMHPSIEPEDVFALFPQFSLPMVVIYQFFHSPKIHCINTDRETAMYQATKYLFSLNHRDIGYLSGPLEWEVSKFRLQGIQRALADEGLRLNPNFYRWCFPTVENGFQITSSILSHPSGKRPRRGNRRGQANPRQQCAPRLRPRRPFRRQVGRHC